MSQLKIALDAGHGLKTPGKQTPDGIKEWILNDAVCDYATEGLKAYDVEVIRTDHNEGYTDESLDARVREYLAAGVTCVISVHHNAFTATWNSATGIEVYTDNHPTADDVKLAKLLNQKISAKTGLKSRGVKKAPFRVINQNKVTAVLCEGGFMDSTNDYKVITSEAGKRAYAEAIVESVVEMYNLKKVTPITITGVPYKVVKKINTYNSAADAKAKKNAKSTYEPGTYYIYNKYPNGVDGMYNISKDSTGAKAGSWINPSENMLIESKPQPAPAPAPVPAPTPTPAPTKINITYQTWDDVANKWLPNVVNNSDYAGVFGHDVCAVYANLSSGNVTYQVHYKGGKWLSEVKNRADYAGIFNKPIDGLAMKTDTGKTIHYKVHLRRQNKWLPYVTGYNTSDSNNGYAGILGQEIDAVKICIE